MKGERRWLVLVMGIIFLGCLPRRDRLADLHRLEFPELDPIEIPEYRREVLPNGMVIYLIEDRALPLIHFRAVVRTGSIWDPEEQVGLGQIALEVMRTGGSGGITGAEVDIKLERVGALIETGIDWDKAWVEGSCLEDNFNEVFAIFVGMLREPLFEQAKIDLSRIKMSGAIARRNDDIEGIAEREFRRIIYGRDNPYARVPEYATLKRITRDALVSFHNEFFHPNNIILGLWGDFETEEMLKKIDEVFGDWEYREVQLPPKPLIDPDMASSVNLIIREDAVQSAIRLGHLGMRRDHPDYFASMVLSRILGGGWHSRFSRRLRAEEGLAYSIWAWQVAEFDYPGLFIAASQTMSERTVEAITLMKREIELIREEKVTDEELEIAREGILNAQVFWFDTKDEVIERVIRYEYYGYPQDYLEMLIEGVKAVTKDDILRVAREHLHPDRLTILVVGNPEDFDMPLSTLGEVRLLDISIPE